MWNQTKYYSRIHETEFTSTKMWKELLRKFTTQVPLQNHKRQLRNYPNTFTGKEALDCMSSLLPTIFTKNCTRDSAIKVLENYIRSKYISNARDESNKQFLEGFLYRLENNNVNAFLDDHPSNSSRRSNVNRASSMREHGNKQLEPINPQLVQPKDWCNLKAKTNFDSSAGWNGIHGRLSMSCQDITLIESQSTRPQPKSSARKNLSGLIANGMNKASAGINIFSVHRSASQSNSDFCNRKTNLNPKYLSDRTYRENNMKQTSIFVPRMCPSGMTKSVFDTANKTSHTEHIRKPQKPRTNALRIDETTNFTFCDRIDKSTYEQQSKTLEPHLQTLLNTILSDENLSPADKFEKLKAFRVSYPTIYAQRFPVHADPLLATEDKQSRSINNVTQDNKHGTSLIKHLQNLLL